MTECPICWNTGFYRGYGGPCEKGCVPPSKDQHGLREEETDGIPPTEFNIALNPPLACLTMTKLEGSDYTDSLRTLVKKACAGEEVTIFWPAGSYAVRTDMAGPQRGAIMFTARVGGPNYVLPLTAELHLEATSSEEGTPRYTGVILTALFAPKKWNGVVNPGDIGEGRKGVKHEGLIVEVLKVDHDPNGRMWIIHLRFLSDHGNEMGRESMSGDFFDRQFKPNPTWRPKFKPPPPTYVIHDTTKNHADQLEKMVKRACKGEEVCICWPTGAFDVRTKVHNRHYTSIYFCYGGQDSFNSGSYRFSLSAPLEVTPIQDGVILKPAIPSTALATP